MSKNVAARPDNSWVKAITPFTKPRAGRATWQLVNSLGAYFLLWGVMIYTFNISYWLTLALAPLAAGFMVRIFIIFHDCGHNSFLKSRKANDFWGIVTGILTFTPYYLWRHDHAVHHASSGDLDRRGMGDVWTLTVKEYEALSPFKQFSYRVYRNPFVMFLIGPTLTFLVFHRLIRKDATRRERLNSYFTTLMIVAIALGMHFLVGFKTYFLIQFPIMFLGGLGGVWLFYVQHQFDPTYWEAHPEWDYVKASLEGSSYYKLPRILQWFTGNIGLHHIHHLNPRIPNYNLQPCLDANPQFHVTPITIRSSLKSLAYRLWDEEHRRLIHFRHLRTLGQKDRSAAN